MDRPPTCIGHYQPLLLTHHEPNILKLELWRSGWREKGEGGREGGGRGEGGREDGERGEMKGQIEG